MSATSTGRQELSDELEASSASLVAESVRGSHQSGDRPMIVVCGRRHTARRSAQVSSVRLLTATTTTTITHHQRSLALGQAVSSGGQDSVTALASDSMATAERAIFEGRWSWRPGGGRQMGLERAAAAAARSTRLRTEARVWRARKHAHAGAPASDWSARRPSGTSRTTRSERLGLWFALEICGRQRASGEKAASGRASCARPRETKQRPRVSVTRAPAIEHNPLARRQANSPDIKRLALCSSTRTWRRLAETVPRVSVVAASRRAREQGAGRAANCEARALGIIIRRRLAPNQFRAAKRRARAIRLGALVRAHLD